MLECTLHIQNRLGLHARASAKLAALAGKFTCDVILVNDDVEINAKSIMGIMMLAAGKGTSLVLRTDGEDEQDAQQHIKALFENYFGEAE
jgi:phosphocarrier protein